MSMSPRLLRPRATGFDPRTITGLAVWLDASKFDTLNGGASPANGANISQWNDRTSNARNAFQATAGNQPTYSATGLNGKPAVQFSAANSSRMSISAAAGTFSTGITLFIVCQKTGANNNFEAFPINRTEGGFARPFDSYNAILFTGSPAANPSLTVQDIRDITTPSVILRRIRTAPLTSPFALSQVNLTTAITGITTDAYADTATEIQLGTRGDDFTKFTGLLSEILIYARADISASDILTIQKALASKWGITL